MHIEDRRPHRVREVAQGSPCQLLGLRLQLGHLIEVSLQLVGQGVRDRRY